MGCPKHATRHARKMTTLITARQNSKIGTFREIMKDRLPNHIVDTICKMAATVRDQREPVWVEHSVALSGPQGRHMMVSLFETGSGFLWGGFLPDGPGASINYTTGHGCCIDVERVFHMGMIHVEMRFDNKKGYEGPEFIECFHGLISANTQHQRVDVNDGIYVMLEQPVSQPDGSCASSLAVEP